MRRSLRQAHGWMWLVLAVLLPAAFVFALSVRQPDPGARDAVKLSPARDTTQTSDTAK